MLSTSSPNAAMSQLSRDEVIDVIRLGASFAEEDLRGLDLSGLGLAGADFEGADLGGTVFDHADLRGASFRHARLHRTRFRGALLCSVDWTGSDRRRCDFQGAVWV